MLCCAMNENQKEPQLDSPAECHLHARRFPPSIDTCPTPTQCRRNSPVCPKTLSSSRLKKVLALRPQQQFAGLAPQPTKSPLPRRIYCLQNECDMVLGASNSAGGIGRTPCLAGKVCTRQIRPSYLTYVRPFPTCTAVHSRGNPVHV